MHIERMHEMIERLTECASSQFAKGMDCVETEEMEKVACIIKDLSEAEYYGKISKAMDDYDYRNERMYYEEQRRERNREHGYPDYRRQPTNYRNDLRDMDRRTRDTMYYPEPTETPYERARRMYSETKNVHKSNSAEDKQAKMKDLEEYTRELSNDVLEMLNDMSMEEKNLLKSKMQILAQKIV